MALVPETRPPPGHRVEEFEVEVDDRRHRLTCIIEQ